MRGHFQQATAPRPPTAKQFMTSPAAAVQYCSLSDRTPCSNPRCRRQPVAETTLMASRRRSQTVTTPPPPLLLQLLAATVPRACFPKSPKRVDDSVSAAVDIYAHDAPYLFAWASKQSRQPIYSATFCVACISGCRTVHLGVFVCCCSCIFFLALQIAAEAISLKSLCKSVALRVCTRGSIRVT